MKRLLMILLAALLCLSLCACGSQAAKPAGKQVWEKGFYLDAFNTPTEEYYLGTATPLTGTFNSASVTDGELAAELRVDPWTVRISLYENGSEKVKNGSVFSVVGYLAGGGDCVVIDEDQFGLLIADTVRDHNVPSIARALCAEDGEVSFYLERADQPASNYLFTVPTGNFAALYTAEIAEPIQAPWYAAAESRLQEKDYDGAIAAFTALGDYRDSAARAED